MTKADSLDSSPMKYVYLIRSESHPKQSYIGITSDLKTRLAVHNSGGSIHTSKYMPWKIVTYLGFTDVSKALDFERYLKTSSGRAFAKKRLW